MKTNLHRITVLSLIFTFSLFISKAQWVNIPDTGFVKHLRTHGYSICFTGSNQTGWQMDTTCPAVVNARSIGIDRQDKVSDLTGVEYFRNLDSFWYYGIGNSVTTITNLPNGLKYFGCNRGNITSLPLHLPDSLTYIDCQLNLLTSLPPLPAGLKHLSCYANQITTLPALPVGLEFLSCGENQIDSLPNALPATLTNLYCDNLYLTALPILPPGLKELSCSANQLTSLANPLPAGLTLLACFNNSLTVLPPLPTTLQRLQCEGNQLVALPALPNSLIYLNARANTLTSPPVLPDSITECYFDNNPTLTCLPRFGKLLYLGFLNTGVTCVPNYPTFISGGYSFPPIDTFPQCNWFNDQGCMTYPGLSGKIYIDANSDCVYGTGDMRLSDIKVKLSSGGNLLEQTIAHAGGYSFDVRTHGNYEVSIDTAGLPFSVTCPLNNLLLDTVSASDSTTIDNDFALSCKSGIDLAAWSIAGRFIPGFTRKVNIRVGTSSAAYGINCAPGVEGSVTITINGPASYTAPAPGALTPDNVNGSVLTYNIADFGLTDFDSSFNIMVQTDISAQLGNAVCITVVVTALTLDAAPVNNIQTHCFTVVGSFDPNDKQVYPLADIDTAQEWLTYTIRFQNTGTAEAQHIYVTDTMDADLDVSSFQLLAYSHQPLVQIKENAVRFNFPNINLPDSNTNEPLSHGYVQYKIKIKDGKPIGTQINNTAFIYFDFNAPVVTNTTVNTITVVSSDKAISHEPLAFRIYPNPASSSVTISADESMIGATATVTDVTGRKMLAVKLTTINGQLTTESFANGVYFVTVTERNGRSATKKLVINR